MDSDLYNRFKGVKLPPELLDMFVEIIKSDDPSRKVLLSIAKYTSNNYHPIGLTIKQISELVFIHRKVLNTKKASFNTEFTNIDRKHAERIVDKLLGMSLCYYHHVKPSKLIRLTERGRQVVYILSQQEPDIEKINN